MQPPALDGPYETAFVAQLSDRRLLKPDHLRQDNMRCDTHPQDYVRRDPRVNFRQDNECQDTRREIRQDHERGNARLEAYRPINVNPTPSLHTLEDLQRTMALIQSQVDKQAAKTCQA